MSSEQVKRECAARCLSGKGAEREAVADFVGCASGGEVAFVEKELRGRKPRERGLAVDPLFEGVERLVTAVAFGTGQGDVGMEETGLGDESAKGSG